MAYITCKNYTIVVSNKLSFIRLCESSNNKFTKASQSIFRFIIEYVTVKPGNQYGC